MAKHNIAWHEKTLGQLFCDGSAKQVVAMLLAECAAAGVVVKLATKVTDIRKSDGFTVETTDETLHGPGPCPCDRRAFHSQNGSNRIFL